jgi:hypothetical protein
VAGPTDITTTTPSFTSPPLKAGNDTYQVRINVAFEGRLVYLPQADAADPPAVDLTDFDIELTQVRPSSTGAAK